MTGIHTCCARRSICSIELALHLAADRAGLVGDEPTEVAGLAVEGQHGDQASQGIDVGDGRPLAQRVDLGEPLADASAHPGQVLAHAPVPRAASRFSAAAERVARAEEHAELLAQHRELQEDAPLPPVGLVASCCSTIRNASDGRTETRRSAIAERRLRGGGRRARPPRTPPPAPAELADAERGGVHRVACDRRAARQVLAHAEQRGQPLTDLPRRADR